jgi:hypothetical protein
MREKLPSCFNKYDKAYTFCTSIDWRTPLNDIGQWMMDHWLITGAAATASIAVGAVKYKVVGAALAKAGTAASPWIAGAGVGTFCTAVLPTSVSGLAGAVAVPALPLVAGGAVVPFAVCTAGYYVGKYTWARMSKKGEKH